MEGVSVWLESVESPVVVVVVLVGQVGGWWL